MSAWEAKAMSFTSSLAEGVIFFEKAFFYYRYLAVLQCQRVIPINILNATYGQAQFKGGISHVAKQVM